MSKNWLYFWILHPKNSLNANLWEPNSSRSPEIEFDHHFLFLPKYGNVTSQQVVKYWKCQESDFIFGFFIQNVAGMQIFEDLTQVGHQKLTFRPHFPLYIWKYGISRGPYLKRAVGTRNFNIFQKVFSKVGRYVIWKRLNFSYVIFGDTPCYSPPLL